MAPFDTRSSQFGLISGIHQPNSDMVLVAEPAGLFAPEARKGQLYIVAEAEQDVARGRDACQLVIQTIRKLFYADSSFSVTSALRKAISAANKALYEQNFSAPPQKRAVVGISCAVIKGNDLYIAQIQPAQAYLLAGGKLRALPAIPAWSTAPPATNMFFKLSAIGASLSIEPEFYRAVLTTGDALLLCTSNLARLLGQPDVTGLLRSALPEEICDGLAAICAEHSLPEAHGLALAIRPALSPAAQAEPLSRAGISERGRLALRRAGGWASRLTSDAALALRGGPARAQKQKSETRIEQARREQARLSELPAEPPRPPAPRPQPLDLGERLDERIDQERQERRTRLGAPPLRPSEHNQQPPSSLLGEGGYASAPPERRIDLSDTPGMAAFGKPSSSQGLPAATPSLGERISLPIVQVADAFSSMGRRRRRRRPPPRALPRSRGGGLSYRRQGPPFPWIWLLVLTLVIAAAVLYGMNLSREITTRQANDSLDRAATAIAALHSSDENTAQSQLDAAAVALSEVRATGGLTATVENRQRYDEMEREYERSLAMIQRLTYFDDLTLLAQHPVPAGLFNSVVVPPPPQGITNTAAFANIYMLDSNAGVLYRMPRAGGPVEPMLRPEDTVGPSVVGKIKAQAWREDNIVAVAQTGEGNGRFTFYFRTGDSWGYNILAGSDVWGRVDEHFRAVNYGGNLYIWGAGSAPDQIQKYLSGNYGQFPEPWIKDAGGQKVDNAIDMAIDGNVYLLKPDNRILVFQAGAFQREIVPKGINPPLITPASFFVAGELDSGSIFLIDYNQRIIEIDKQTGELIQQIRARPDSPYHLDQMTSLYVDTAGARPVLYMVNGGQILRATLPDRPRPLAGPSDQTPAGNTTPGVATPSPTTAP